MRKTVKSLENEVINLQLNCRDLVNRLTKEEIKTKELKQRLESRAVQETTQILDAMARMMEAASKTVLSLHNNM